MSGLGYDCAYGNMKKEKSSLYFSFLYIAEATAECEENGSFTGTAELNGVGKSLTDLEEAVKVIENNLPLRISKSLFSAYISFESSEKAETDNDVFYTVKIKLKIKEWRCI